MSGEEMIWFDPALPNKLSRKLKEEDDAYDVG